MSALSLASSDWFSAPDRSSLWIRFYSSLHQAWAGYLGRMAELVPMELASDLANYGDPIKFDFVQLGGMSFPVSTTKCWAEEDGTLGIHTFLSTHELPGTGLIMLSTPLSVDGAEGSEAISRQRLDRAAGVFRAFFGRSFMWEILFEGKMDLKDGSYSSPGDFFRTPQIQDGPFLHRLSFEESAEIFRAIRGQNDPKKSRLLLALELLDAAISNRHGFFEYWTSLEVLCDGKSGKIRSKLGKHYDMNQHEIGYQSGLDTFAKWRHEFFHRGVKPHLTPSLERYSQLLFLDLLRFELNLPLKGHLVGILKEPSFDLSPLRIGAGGEDEVRVNEDVG